jgi:hypothetical protein
VSSFNPAQRLAIDRAKELLVEGAETLLKDAGVKPGKHFGHSQLRNLVAVAIETESPAVVLNFIRYQMGRDDRHEHWSLGSEGKRLGDQFLKDLHDKEGTVEKAFVQMNASQWEPVQQQLARMELIRYFLGFATRYMKYLEL